MAKYRIVRHKHSETAHYVQEKVFGLFWITIGGKYRTWDLNTCVYYIEREAEAEALRQQLKKEYPKAVIVKEIEV